MDKAINKTITEYIRQVQQKYPDFEAGYVFGSHAKGNPNQDSDIDLALIFKDLDGSNRFDFQVQLMLIASRIDSRIEPHPISEKDFNSGNSFVMEIKKTGIEIVEKAV